MTRKFTAVLASFLLATFCYGAQAHRAGAISPEVRLHGSFKESMTGIILLPALTKKEFAL